MAAKIKTKGFSLIELMIAVGVIAVIATIGIPMYQDYITTARIGVMSYNIQTINLLQDDRRVRDGEYVQGNYDPADPDNAAGLKTVLGWDPQTDPDIYLYVLVCETVSAAPPECTRASGYTVTATHIDGGETVVKIF